MKKVVILHWAESAYDSLSGLLTLAGRELEPADYQVLNVTIGADGWQQALERALGGGDCAFALVMSGVGLNLATADGTLLWQAMKVPLFTWYCDHPAYFPARHGVRSNYVVQGYVFPDHALYHRDHLHPNGTAYSVHCGIPARANFCGEPRPLGRRNGRILFAKSGGDPAAFVARWRQNLTPTLARVLEAAAEELAGRPTADFAGAIAGIADGFGLHPAPNGHLMMMLIREADQYLRARRSSAIAAALKPYPVDVVGAGWDHLDWSDGAAAPGGTIRFAELTQRLPDYLASISLNPLVERSTHDRVFCALSAGITPIGEANAFTAAHLPDLAPYGFSVEPGSIEAAIEAVLADPARALEATEATHAAALPNFSLRRSMAQIEEFCLLHPLNAPI